jgi:hypothetical protein
MQLSMLDGLGLQQLPPRFTHFADHVAHSRPRVNTRPIAATNANELTSTWASLSRVGFLYHTDG